MPAAERLPTRRRLGDLLLERIPWASVRYQMVRLQMRARAGGPDDALARWIADRGDVTLRLDYPLTQASIVMDVGGYRGDWSAEIARRYDPRILIFEPVPAFAEDLFERFKENEKIQVFAFGLQDRDTDLEITELGDASSTYRSDGPRRRVAMRDICQVIDEQGLREVDLIKLNIEGSEYPLLERLVGAGYLQRFKDLQIQFHSFVPDAAPRRGQIRSKLSMTHYLTYDYPFIWENWRRRA